MLFWISRYRPAFNLFRRRGIKTVAVCHADRSASAKYHGKKMAAAFLKLWSPLYLNRFDTVIFPTKYLLTRYPKVENGRVCAFLGIDQKILEIERENEPKDNIDILHIGRLSPEKNIGFLFDAATILTKKQKTVRWYFVGGGPELQLWKEKEKERIFFVGQARPREMVSWYKRADIVVSACEIEAFGLTIVESMGSGLPVVVTDKGGGCSRYKNNISGLTYEANNLGSFLKRVESLIFDKKTRELIGRNAKRLPLTWEQATTNLLETIKD